METLQISWKAMTTKTQFPILGVGVSKLVEWTLRNAAIFVCNNESDLGRPIGWYSFSPDLALFKFEVLPSQTIDVIV